MQKAGDCGDISPQIFLDFTPNFRLRTRNQYCTQAIAEVAPSKMEVAPSKMEVAPS